MFHCWLREGSGDALQFSGQKSKSSVGLHQPKPTLLLKGRSVPAAHLLVLLDQTMSELGRWADLADHGVTSTRDDIHGGWRQCIAVDHDLPLQWQPAVKRSRTDNECIVISVL